MDPDISSQPAQAEVSPQSPLSAKIGNSKKMFWIFFAIFILIAFTVGGYFLGAKQNKLNVQKQITPAPSPAEVSAKAGDPTANWKTYINTDVGFQIKYLNSWTEKGPVNSSDNTLVYLNADESIGIGSESSRYYVWIAAEDKLPNVSLVKELVGNYTAYKTSELPSRFGALSIFITKDGSKYISISLTPYDLKNPFESQDKYINIFNQMLSTFKFTDQNQTNPTAANNVFEVKELGIKFKITADIKDLIYQMDNVIAGVARFSTESLARYVPYCSASHNPLGSYSKIYKSELINTNDPNVSPLKTVEGIKKLTVARGIDLASAKEFSDFYILYQGPQATCSEDEIAIKLQIQQGRALFETLPTVELIN